jgi:RimJ/RimL family protein N-acetyltransferase
LLGHAIDYAKTAGFRVIVAIALGWNDRSIKFLKRYKLSESGRICKAAIIRNQLVDHLYMSLLVNDQVIT